MRIVRQNTELFEVEGGGGFNWLCGGCEDEDDGTSWELEAGSESWGEHKGAVVRVLDGDLEEGQIVDDVAVEPLRLFFVCFQSEEYVVWLTVGDRFQ